MARRRCDCLEEPRIAPVRGLMIRDGSDEIVPGRENGEVVVRFKMDAQFYFPPPTFLAGVNPSVQVGEGVAVTINLQDILAAINIAIPNCVADIAVHVFKDSDGIFRYRMEGQHDKFPWFSINVNGEDVLPFDPEATGSSPNALFSLLDKRQLSEDARVLRILP